VRVADLEHRDALYRRILQLPPRQRDAALAALQLARAQAARAAGSNLRVNFEPFRDFILRVAPWFKLYRHAEALIEHLQALIDGDIRNLFVAMPPRHGKSELTSRLLPAWVLHCYPAWWVGVSSYAGNMALTFSRAARRYYQEAGNTLSQDQTALTRWETPWGGGLWASGVGGQQTGAGANVLVCDDPVKNRKEAESDVISEDNWAWWRSTWSTRGPRNRRRVLTMTRWSRKDLAGRIFESLEEDGAQWHVLDLPGLSEPNRARIYPASVQVAPDWRQPGDALCPELFPRETLLANRIEMGTYDFEALVQQNPTVRTGTVFKTTWFDTVLTTLPVVPIRWFRGVDLAGTDGEQNPKADYTADMLVGVYVVDGLRRYVLAGGDEVQYAPGARNAHLLSRVQFDRAHQRPHVQWLVEREAGIDAKKRERELVGMFPGVSLRFVHPESSKVVRADGFRAAAEAGLVSCYVGPGCVGGAGWVPKFLERLAAFPAAPDDWVDATVNVFRGLVTAGRAGDFEMTSMEV
jgi:predicted phage terminase large subunit-like protein